MSPQNQHQESQVLRFSCLLAAIFAAGGIVVGLMLGSIVIAFDGVYSLISLLLTLLSLASAKFIHAPHDSNFPNGRAIIEPMVIAIKGATILAVVLYSMYRAVDALFHGGVALNIGVASGFAIVNIVGCAFAWWKIQQMSKRHHSGLMDAEAKQWKMDTVLSVAVAIGFMAAWIMTLTPLASYAAYADPVLMLLVSGYFMKVPLEMVKSSGRELLQMSPSKELLLTVHESVDCLDRTHGIAVNSVVKVGHELRIDLQVETTPDKLIAAKELSVIKQAITRRLSAVPLDVKLNLNLAV